MGLQVMLPVESKQVYERLSSAAKVSKAGLSFLPARALEGQAAKARS